MLARLGIGTVQFGMPYGVSNHLGQPSESEVAGILEQAGKAGVEYIDTAFAYPNSEMLIGRHLPKGYDFKIVSKTSPLEGARFEAHDKAKILDGVASSLDRLKVDCLYGLLVHHAADLDKPGWEYLVEALEDAKSRGWVQGIGSSVYDERQLALVESRFMPDLVQGPFNVLDTRLSSCDCFKRLKAGGTEMHARSVFLQGLLLMPPSTLPPFFGPVSGILSALRESWEEQGVSPLAACLAFVMDHPEIDVAIVGVNNVVEFEGVRSAILSCKAGAATWPDMGHSIDVKYIDPSQWPAFPH